MCSVALSISKYDSLTMKGKQLGQGLMSLSPTSAIWESWICLADWHWCWLCCVVFWFLHYFPCFSFVCSLLSNIVSCISNSNSSLGCQVKNSGHDKLQLHGAGKKFNKSEVERIMHRMVFEKIFREEVNKSDYYGSVSSIVKVCEQCWCTILMMQLYNIPGDWDYSWLVLNKERLSSRARIMTEMNRHMNGSSIIEGLWVSFGL